MLAGGRMAGSQADTLGLTTLQPAFAAEVTGMDLRRAAASEYEWVWRALAEHPLLVFRAQALTASELVEVGRGLGEPERYDDPVPGYEEQPEIAAFSNDDARGIVPEPYWHTDGLGRATPPELTIFHAVEVPSRGGETAFCDARALYDGLEAEDRETLGQLVAEYLGGTRHPLVKVHPRTRRTALYANLGAMTELIGVDRESAETVLAELWAVYDEAPAYRHRYREGDVLIWDDYSVAHSASDPPPASERRLLLRVDVRPE
jgi:taurine dioxygenase